MRALASICWLWLLCLAPVFLTACVTGAQTQVISSEGPRGTSGIDSGFWLHAAGHLALSDRTRLDSSDNELEIEEPDGDNSAPGFGLGARYSLEEDALGFCCVDLGLHVAHLGSGRYFRFETTRRVGSMMEAVGDLRWRFLERSWGGLYAGMGLGWGGVRLSRELEFDLETKGNTGPLKPLQHAVIFIGEVGMVWYLDRDMVLRTGFSTRQWRGQLREENELDLVRFRTVLSVGLEWAL